MSFFDNVGYFFFHKTDFFNHSGLSIIKLLLVFLKKIKKSDKHSFILILIFNILFFNNLSYSKDFKLPDITPKDLVNDGYVLHSITPISEEGARVMIYTFIKNKTKIVSCVVELFDISGDLHVCYNVTN